MKTLSIVTLWWNRLDLLPDYKKVVGASCANEIIIIDNGSEPPFECDEFKIIRNATNRGFSRGCNQGLRAATSDVVLFLNNDIKPSSVRKWGKELLEKVGKGVLVGANMRSDLCLRATHKGFKLMEVDLPIHHIVNGTSKVFDLSKVTPSNYMKFAAKVRKMRRAK